MQNSIAVFTCLFFDQKCRFLPNWILKVKIISFSWNLVPTLIRIPAQISMVMFPFFYFQSEMPFFWGKFGPKCQNCQFKTKFVQVASLIRICRIQRWCSLFSFSIGNALFWANLVEKAEMASSSWNFVYTYCFG